MINYILKKLKTVTETFLNTIDIKKIYDVLYEKNDEVTLDDLMFHLERKYNYSELLPEELYGLLFNVYDKEDFLKYLKNRYPNLTSTEEVSINYYIKL